jgi:hypothetical protein
VMMPRTVVVLDGRRSAYSSVPDHARIVRMEVAADRKTVLRVFFRTRR